MRFTYDHGMTQDQLDHVRKTTEDLSAIERVRQGVEKVETQEVSYKEALTERNYAIFEASEDGVSAIKLAELAGVSRQQVHKIVAELGALRYGWTLDD